MPTLLYTDIDTDRQPKLTAPETIDVTTLPTAVLPILKWLA